MATLDLRNQAEEALPAERDRGLVAYFDGPFECGTDNFVMPILEARTMTECTAVCDVTLNFDPKVVPATKYIFDGPSGDRVGMAVSSGLQLFAYFAGQVVATSDGSWSDGISQGDRIQIAFVFNSSAQFFIYVDGVQVQGPIGKPADEADLSIAIGSTYSSTNLGESTVHSLRVFRRTLTLEEIVDLRDNTSAKIPTPLIQLPATNRYDDPSGPKGLDGTVYPSTATKLAFRGYQYSGAEGTDIGDITFNSGYSVLLEFVLPQTSLGSRMFLLDSDSIRIYAQVTPAGDFQVLTLGSLLTIPAADWQSQSTLGGSNVFAATHDGSTHSVYFNGQLISSVANAQTFPKTAANVNLGRGASDTFHFVGNLGFASFWDHPLTETQIRAVSKDVLSTTRVE